MGHTLTDQRQQILGTFEAIDKIEHSVDELVGQESPGVQVEHAGGGASRSRVAGATSPGRPAGAVIAELYEAVLQLIKLMPPIPVAVAAELLDMSKPTVSRWASEGVLRTVDGDRPVMQLDPERLHEVRSLVRDLREQGAKPGQLMEQVWWRLEDNALMRRDDLQESLAELRRGDVVEA